jgi:hypothetical protein
MATRVADEREQRRGLILGLTLAEIMLLFLFILLLVLGSQISKWRDRYEQLDETLEELKPLQEALAASGAADVNNVQDLILRFRNLRNAEQVISKLKAENADLAARSELANSLGLSSDEKRRAVASIIKRASEIDPNDPPAVLKRALDVIDRLGTSTRPDQVKSLSEMTAGPELEKKLAGLEAELDQTRRERNNLMRGPGNGLTYPSCWTNDAGKTEYIFDVIFGDAGVQVKDATPGRAKDDAWNKVEHFARDTMINEKIFIQATKKLFEWSETQRCRFYVVVHDATGASKARYKHLQELVQGNFYPFYPSPQRRGPERLTPPGSLSEDPGSTAASSVQQIR